MTDRLVRVTGEKFVAGLIMRGDRCTWAAPILRWAIGKTEGQLRKAFAARGYAATQRPDPLQ